MTMTVFKPDFKIKGLSKTGTSCSAASLKRQCNKMGNKQADIILH